MGTKKRSAAVGSRGASDLIDVLGSNVDQPSSPIRAELQFGTATAAGLTATSLCGLCRALVAAGHAPHRGLHAYRGEVLALKVKSIAAAARLTIREGDDPPHFVMWRAPQRRRPAGQGALNALPATPVPNAHNASSLAGAT